MLLRPVTPVTGVGVWGGFAVSGGLEPKTGGGLVTGEQLENIINQTTTRRGGVTVTEEGRSSGESKVCRVG